MRHRRPRSVDRAKQVGLDHLAVLLFRRPLKAREQSHPRVVDPYIDMPKALHGALRQVLDLIFLAHIRRDRQHLGSRLPAFIRRALPLERRMTNAETRMTNQTRTELCT